MYCEESYALNGKQDTILVKESNELTLACHVDTGICTRVLGKRKEDGTVLDLLYNTPYAFGKPVYNTLVIPFLKVKSS